MTYNVTCFSISNILYKGNHLWCIEEGKPADFLVLDALSAFEAIRLIPARLHVFKAGRVIASTTPAKSVVMRNAESQGQEVTFRPEQ